MGMRAMQTGLQADSPWQAFSMATPADVKTGQLT